MSVLANRYVEALFQSAQSAGVVDSVQRDLGRLGAVLDDRGNRLLLLDPRLPAAKKRALFQKLLPDMQPLTGRFLDMVIGRRRDQILPEVGRSFRTLALQARGAVEGVLQTASPVPDELVQKLARAAEKALGKTVEVAVEPHPELIGGVRLIVGHRMFDGSIEAALLAMRQRMLEAALVR